MKILWLASWYPNPADPFDGDFIQRHAKAVSANTAVTVFFVYQSGNNPKVPRYQFTTAEKNGLTEKILLFSQKKKNPNLLEKLLYNFRYHRYYRKVIREHILLHGKPDLVHVHVPMKAGMIARWIKRQWNIPYIISEQSSHYSGDTDDDYSRKSAIHRYWLKKIFADAAIVTNVSATIGAKLNELFNPKEIHCIHNTVDTSLFRYKPLTPARFRFVHVSTLRSHQKNPEGILKAVAELALLRSDFEMQMVGPASAALKQLAETLQISQSVHFTGEVPYTQVAEEMQQSNAFILFSRHENFPCVVVEALSCGLPVITTPAGGTAEAIHPGNGLVVEKEDSTGLARAMDQLMNNYTEFDRASIAGDAHRKYGYATIGKQFFDLYKRMQNTIPVQG